MAKYAGQGSARNHWEPIGIPLYQCIFQQGRFPGSYNNWSGGLQNESGNVYFEILHIAFFLIVNLAISEENLAMKSNDLWHSNSQPCSDRLISFTPKYFCSSMIGFSLFLLQTAS